MSTHDAGLAAKINNRRVVVLLGLIALAMSLFFGIKNELFPFVGSKLHPGYVVVTVVRTCGAEGGDCVLTERFGPSSDARRIRDLPQGTTLTVTCQVEGTPVKATSIKNPTKVWSRTEQGG